MQIAKIKISNNRAAADRQQILTSGTIGAAVSFELDSLWDGLTVTAVFRAGDVTKDAAEFDPAGTVIPWEVLAQADVTLYCGLYGVNGTGDLVIPTVWASLGRVMEGADPSGDPAADPTLPIWASLQQQIDQLKQSGTGDTAETVVGNEILSSWKGCGFISAGDSIAFGEGSDKKYAHIVRDEMGMQLMVDLSAQGRVLTDFSSGYASPLSMDSNLARLTGEDVKLILLEGGTNDFHCSVPMGEAFVTAENGSRTFNEDNTTFKGALNKIVRYLQNQHPLARIVFFTPLHRGAGKAVSDLTRNNQGLYLSDYVAAIRDLADYHSIEILDLYGCSGLNPNVAANAAVYFDPDGSDLLHPNTYGHQVIANEILALLGTMYPLAGEYQQSAEIPATAITLSAATLTFTDSASQTLTASPEPGNTTDEILWTTSDSGVAAVSGGVVTPVSNGSCAITATAGSVSASCQVTVDVPAEIVAFSISRTLTGCVSSSDVAAVNEGDAHSETIAAETGYTLDGAAVLVTIGGEDVTADVYTDGIITISEMTGDLVIEVAAVEQTEEESGTPIDFSGFTYTKRSIKENGAISSYDFWYTYDDHVDCTGFSAIRYSNVPAYKNATGVIIYGISFYDSGDAFISGVGVDDAGQATVISGCYYDYVIEGTCDIPDNASYALFSYRKSNSSEEIPVAYLIP